MTPSPPSALRTRNATLWNIGRELTDVSEWRDELAADTAGAAEGVIPGDAVHQVAHA